MRILSEWAGALRISGRWWIALVLCVYVGLVVLGITNSSLAVLDDPADGAQGLLLGQPRPIRSDEWIKATPMLIGQLSSGNSSFMPTLATSILYGGTSTAGPVSALLTAEYVAAGQVDRLSLNAGLAAAWWFPALLFALGLPSLLQRFQAPLSLGIAAVVAIAFSPVNAWFSWTPVRISAYVCVAAAAAVAATVQLSDTSRGRRRLLGIAWIVLAGLMLAKLALSYTPWAITIGLPVLSVTAAWLMWRRSNWRTALVVVSASAVLGVTLMAGYVFENHEYYGLWPRRSTLDPARSQGSSWVFRCCWAPRS